MNLQEMLSILTTIAAILTSITAILVGILALFGKLTEVWNTILKPLWNRVLKPFTKLVAFLTSLIIPNGLIIWFFLDLAVKNQNRLGERMVILVLIAQSTTTISLYTLLWGMWLYPLLRSLLRTQKQVVQ